MTVPVFEDIDPASDCDCPGCVHVRRTAPRPSYGRFQGRPAVRGAVVVAAAASAVLGAVSQATARTAVHSPPNPADPAAQEAPGTPQGATAPLHGQAGGAAQAPAARITATTRTQIINRAKLWVAAKVPYSTTAYWSDGYRQDCSGFVSMAWGLLANEWTGSLASFGARITKEELEPGDMLLFHNAADPQNGSHVVIFGGWTDYTHKNYTAYEQTPPHARGQSTPYPYWNHTDGYVPYRYKGVTAGSAGAAPGTGTATPFPGTSYFGPGADNAYVTQLGRLLVARGGGRYYTTGPGPRWGEADRRATQAFQQAQGWTGSAADGLPGPRTWELLVTHTGKDIPPGAKGPSVPAFPGTDAFRPGADNAYVTRLGQHLVKKGYGRYYATGPGPRWGEADRRATQAFQQAQGWRGAAADGYPGPETWRRLFT